MLALKLGATFVARGFSGDKAQLVPLIEAAVLHKGAAFIDVISPCVAFNNHPGLDQELRLRARAQRSGQRLDVMVPRDPITAEYGSGSLEEVVLHDGGTIRLRKVHADFDPTDRLGAMNYLHERGRGGRNRDRAPVRASGLARPARRAGNGRHAAQRVVRRRPRPRRRGARGVQREPALTSAPP